MRQAEGWDLPITTLHLLFRGPAWDCTHFTLKSSAVILLLSMFRRILLVSMAAHRIWKRNHKNMWACNFLCLQKSLEETPTWGILLFHILRLLISYVASQQGNPCASLSGPSLAEVSVLSKCRTRLPQTIISYKPLLPLQSHCLCPLTGLCTHVKAEPKEILGFS